MKCKELRPWVVRDRQRESLVSHAGATLLVETARRSGLARQLSRLHCPPDAEKTTLAVNVLVSASADGDGGAVPSGSP
jgi:hypothetical protein